MASTTGLYNYRAGLHIRRAGLHICRSVPFLMSLGSTLPGLGSIFVSLSPGDLSQNHEAQPQSSLTAPVRKYRALAFRHIFIGRQPCTPRGGAMKLRSPTAINLTRGWASRRINHPLGFQNWVTTYKGWASQISTQNSEA